MARTPIIVRDHIKAIIDHLDDNTPFPVGEWERPEDPTTQRFLDPPFAYVRVYPSAAQFDGPISDTQADVMMRFQVMGAGVNMDQAITVTDICHRQLLDRRAFTIPNRRIMNLRRMVVAGGNTRGEDVPDPFHHNMDLYEIQTTPN